MRTPLPTLAIDGLDRLIAALQGLPIGMHGGALLALIAGLGLWLFGARFLKPAFGLLGMCVGSLAGAVALPMMGVMQVGSFPSVYVGLAAGAALGLLASCLLFRFALGIASGIVFVVVGVLGASIYLNQHAPGTVDPPARLLLAPLPEDVEPVGEAGWSPGSSLTFTGSDGTTTTVPSGASGSPASHVALTGLSSETESKIRAHAARARSFVDEMSRRGREAWASVGARERLILTGGGIGGGVIGVLFGLTMPRRSAAMVTSLFGASVVLSSAVWLAGATDAPGKQMLELQPMGVVIALAIATAVGMLVQLTMTGRRAGAKPDGD